MEYSSKLGAWKKKVTLRLTDNMLELLDEERRPFRQITLDEIRRIQQFDGIATDDPDTGRYQSEFCKLIVDNGRPIHFRNGTYIRPAGKYSDIATNQDAEYRNFLDQLKRQLLAIHPDVIVQSGALMASLAWWGCALLGLTMIAIGVAAFFFDKFTTALMVALFCFGSGGLLVYMGCGLGSNYWPKRQSLAESLQPSSEVTGGIGR